MCRSWGFGVPKTTLAILVSGIWNVFLKLGLPIIALVLLVAEGRATGGLVGAAIFGLAVLVVAVLRAHPGAAQRPAGRRSSGAGSSGSCRSRCGWPGARPPRRPRRRARLPPPQQRAHLAVLAAPHLVDAARTRCCSSRCSCCACACWVRPRWPPSRSSPPSPSAGCCPPSRSPRAASGSPTPRSSARWWPSAATRPSAPAGVLLFTGFTYLLEIPVGGISWVVWSRAKSWRRPVTPEPA